MNTLLRTDLQTVTSGNLPTDLSPIQTVREQQIHIFKNLSYSNNLILHGCEKKWQISRLGGSISEEEQPGNVTFAFGHAMGAALQTLFIPGKTKNDAALAALLAWDVPIWEELPKKKKSFWYVLKAIDTAEFFVREIQQEGWEIAHFMRDGKLIPAVEFSFVLHLPDGFRYNAHIDLILYNKELNKYRIIEVKTSGFSEVPESVFGNSSQALSYSIVLDYLTQHQTTYDVLYIVYSCPTREFVQLPFSKSSLVKAEWIRDILYDCEKIKGLIASNYFPKRGERCYDFFRTCEYYGGCGYSDPYLGIENPITLGSIIKRETENTKIDRNNKRGYDVEISLEDLLADKLNHLQERKELSHGINV